MNRREFLSSAAALFVVPASAVLAEAPPAYALPFLGKYVGHECARGDVGYVEMKGPDDRTLRYVSFPIESWLAVEFESGTMNYVAFNVSRDLESRIERTPVADFMPKNAAAMFKDEPWPADSDITFVDNKSTVEEWHPGFVAENFKPRTVKYRLAPISFKGPGKSGP